MIVGTPATRISAAARYGIAAFETSASVTRSSTSRARGPARFIAASSLVVFVTSTRRSVPASHQRIHWSIASRLPGPGGHEEPIATEAGDGAVVEDDAGLVGHRAVADAPGAQVAEPVRVQPVEIRPGVRAADVELAERGDVDEADTLADGVDIRRDRSP